MWPFRKKGNSGVFDLPRYKNKPALLLFEYFILDIIGHLSQARRDGIQKMDLKKLFSTRSADWKQSLKTTLRLSATIETAILHRWYKEKDKDTAKDPESFSKEFADEYFKNDSQVDMWTEKSLAEAKKYIEESKKKGISR